VSVTEAHKRTERSQADRANILDKGKLEDGEKSFGKEKNTKVGQIPRSKKVRSK
jgi:hypothetical protein